MNTYLFTTCATIYATLAILIAIQARHAANFLLAICCFLTALWSVGGLIWTQPLLDGIPGFLDLIRTLIWYTYLLYLFKRTGAGSDRRVYGFGLIGLLALLAGCVALYTSSKTPSYTLLSEAISIRIFLSVCELLLIENLYLSLPERARWHIALPCVLLGSLACFDILANADAVLYRHPSVRLVSGRMIVLMVIAPLFALCALRNQRWNEPLRLSHSIVFHSATLLLSGSVLLALALAGEIFRFLDGDWGWIAQLALVFTGLIGVLLFLSSRSAKSLVDHVIVHHFFANRYDYRQQWLNCIETLSGGGSNDHDNLPTRAVRTIADVVNSPNGTLFLLDSATNTLRWATSWNMAVVEQFSSFHPIMRFVDCDSQVADLRHVDHVALSLSLIKLLGPVWLIVQLRHSNGIIGIVIVGPPRTPFRLDQEVFDLLGILGREVGTYVAEQLATRNVTETKSLHKYSKRFAFVAHDIKNISSQLALLLSNAEHYIENPDFRRDMLQTVRSSVQKIDRLLYRLDYPIEDTSSTSISALSHLTSLLAPYQRSIDVSLTLKSDGTIPNLATSPEVFDAIITHVLNNAIDASPNGRVEVTVEHKPECVVIEILDYGKGMSEEFIRDKLFVPFETDKIGGSGIGAFQARELIREAGGELTVTSQQGIGTKVRLIFKPVSGDLVYASRNLLVQTAGE